MRSFYMAKVKKNYSINADIVELINEIADRLNLHQGEVIESIVYHYGVKFYDDCLKAMAEDEVGISVLTQLTAIAGESLKKEESVDFA